MTLQVYVQVEDLNDNKPLSEYPVYTPSVAENSPKGTRVATIRAKDPDVGPGGIFYSIVAGDPQSLFDIDPKTGK